MVKVRTQAFKTFIKLSKLLRTAVNENNLHDKRLSFARLEKYFPLSKDVDISSVDNDGFKGEWITTPQSSPDKVVLYMHGGGFVFRSNLFRDMISRIARAGKVKAFSLDYGLAPEHPFPTALNETIAAYKWLLKDYPPTKIVLAGDSAGGSLVLSALHQIREEKLPMPACAVAIAPATDAALTGPSVITNRSKDFFITKDMLEYFINAYFKDTPKDHPIGSPLYGSPKGFPPLLFHIDESEIMYDDSARFVKKAHLEGINAELYVGKGLWHVWHVFARYVPEARIAIEHIGKFIQNNLGSKQKK